MSTDTGPQTTPADATSLRLERTYEATAEEVFDAWTSPEVLRRWWAVDPTWRTPVAEVDLRPGGRYRLAMENPDGGVTYTVGGEYLTVERPQLLVYSWCWEGQGDQAGHESTVTVRFVGDGERTTVVLEHTGLESPASRDQHRHGWIGCLDSLGARVFAMA